MSKYVLDRSAILAVLRREKGAEKVIPHLYGGLVSTITIAELLTQAAKRGANIQVTFETLKRLQLEIVPFTENQAVLFGDLSSKKESIELSHSDLTVLSLAAEHKATVLTANNQLAKVKCRAKIRMFRKTLMGKVDSI